MYNLDPTEIVDGGAKGIDYLGKKWAIENYKKFKTFPANWDEFGKAAGHIRNGEMAQYSDALLLIWDGESKGSANMRKQMDQLDKPIYEVIFKNNMEPI